MLRKLDKSVTNRLVLYITAAQHYSRSGLQNIMGNTPFAPAEDREYLLGSDASADWSLLTAEGPGGFRQESRLGPFQPFHLLFIFCLHAGPTRPTFWTTPNHG